MANKYATQGALLVDSIRTWRNHKGTWPTYAELMRWSSFISVCPWKRLMEPSAQRALKKGEVLKRGVNQRGMVTFEIARQR